MAGCVGSADLQEIQQVLFRYCAGIDRKDWTLVGSCYAPGAVDHHGDFTGSAEDFLRWVAERHERVVQSFHFVSNIRLVEERPGAAVTETLCFVRQTLLRRGGQQLRLSIGCRYLDLFRSHEGRWLISRRHVTYDWVEEEPPVRDLLEGSDTLARTDRGTDSIEVLRMHLIEGGGMAHGEDGTENSP